jgi:hypothetical protein
MTNRAVRIETILQTLVTNTPDVAGAALVSSDGLTIASALAAGADEDRISAMAAAVLSLGARTTEELGRAELEQVIIKGRLGYVIIMFAGVDAVLEVITGSAAKLGMVQLDMKRAAVELARLAE